MAEKEYIERGEAKRVMKANEWLNPAIPNVVNVILDRLPAADVVEVVHGEWLPVSDDDQNDGEYYCSVCNAEEFFPENAPFAPFCWHCGAKMDGE